MTETIETVEALAEKAATGDAEIRTPSYPPIADYAVIGDCRAAALVSRDGAIEWLCWPHFSAPSVFAAILDRGRGGRFATVPEKPYTSSRRYVEHTNVLETTFRTSGGTVRVTDLMPLPPDRHRLEPMREVLRIVEGVDGRVDLRVIVEPRPDYGRRVPRFTARRALGWAWSWRNELLTLRTDAPLAPVRRGAALEGCFAVGAGERFSLSFCYARAEIGCFAPLGSAAAERRDATLEWWRAWAHRSRYAGPYREAVERSALTLKLMTYALSGGVVAAPTTSLPETVGGVRNWDYRYCWLRDAALTMRAFTGLGYREEAGAFFRWLLHTTRLTRPRLQVLYDVYGRASPPEQELPNLAGYARSAPVRIGNDACTQLQLDTYGGVLYAALDYVRSGGKLSAAEGRLLAGFGRSVVELWRCADSGMWEIRGERRQYTISKVWCWTALDCLLALHERGFVDIPVKTISAEREAIAKLIEARAFNANIASYVATLDGDTLDASLLLMVCLGYKHPDDPRMRSTYDLIRRRLERRGLLYRYEAGIDRLPPGEAAFGICSFWAVDHLVCRGEIEEAHRVFERAISYANDLGLFAEEIDPGSGAHLGNFPQAFTHVGLIFAALSLEHPEQRRMSHR